MNTFPPLHIVLYEPEIPQNTGNIGRTCVALNAKLWLVRPLGFRLDAKHVRRAGLDYWQHLDYELVDSWDDIPLSLPEDRMWLFTKKATKLYTDVAYQPNDVLVFGAETRGLPDSLLSQYADQRVRIPIGSQVRSLNLSNAVAVAAYEVVRQWGSPGPDVGTSELHESDERE